MKIRLILPTLRPAVSETCCRGPGDGTGLLHQQQAVLHGVREPRDAGGGAGAHHRGGEDLLLWHLPL